MFRKQASPTLKELLPIEAFQLYACSSSSPG
ncbi:hypothetical protein BGP_6274 [Beggiatoa sp. PS]|nr:hypothetical protein BGP_6274 [Beggiatoa sp. PS]